MCAFCRLEIFKQEHVVLIVNLVGELFRFGGCRGRALCFLLILLL